MQEEEKKKEEEKKPPEKPPEKQPEKEPEKQKQERLAKPAPPQLLRRSRSPDGMARPASMVATRDCRTNS